MTETTLFGDMNGPLQYWGPAPSSATPRRLASVQATPAQLRAQLQGTRAATLPLAQAFADVLATRQPVSAAA